jgi:hypothetical protein
MLQLLQLAARLLQLGRCLSWRMLLLLLLVLVLLPPLPGWPGCRVPLLRGCRPWRRLLLPLLLLPAARPGRLLQLLPLLLELPHLVLQVLLAGPLRLRLRLAAACWAWGRRRGCAGRALRRLRVAQAPLVRGSVCRRRRSSSAMCRRLLPRLLLRAAGGLRTLRLLVQLVSWLGAGGAVLLRLQGLRGSRNQARIAAHVRPRSERGLILGPARRQVAHAKPLLPVDPLELVPREAFVARRHRVIVLS